MWRERSVRHVLAAQARADLAVFGVGALHASVPSHVYTSGYLEDVDRTELEREGVVGDICTVFLRPDGTWEDIALNARSSGPNPRQLAGIERRLCVVAGSTKVVALRAALLTGAVTDLVVDENTASGLLALGPVPYRRTRST